MDRNEKARREFELAQARRQFQQAYASGQIRALDRFVGPIEQGDLVIFMPRDPLVFQVVSVGPSLDPSMPAGIVEIQLACTVPVSVPGNTPTLNMIRVGKANKENPAGGELTIGNEVAGSESGAVAGAPPPDGSTETQRD